MLIFLVWVLILDQLKKICSFITNLVEEQADSQKESLIIYQTFNPSDKTLKDIIENNPEKFLDEEINLRKEKKLPPFSRLIALIISSNDQKESFLQAKNKKKSFDFKNIEILGPVTSPIFKIKTNIEQDYC